MPLTCDCNEDDEADWYWIEPNDYSTPVKPVGRSRRPRCQSCFDLIDFGSTILKFDRFRHPKTEIEEQIYGEGGRIELAPHYHCERCADLFLSLSELGFCVSPEENMLELVKEYAELREELK